MGRALELQIEPGELRCYVDEEGFEAVVARLAIRPEVLRSALRGRCRLPADCALALRGSVDLRPFEENEAEA